MEFVVRPATSSDRSELDKVSTSAIATLRKTYRPTRHAVAQRRSSEQELKQLVATHDERVVGSVEYRLDKDRLHFLSLFVHHEYRRQGVARCLVEQLVVLARQAGIDQLTAYTIKETGAWRAFERLGFGVIREEATDLYESDESPHMTEVYLRRVVD